MSAITLTSAQSPYTFQPEQFSNLVNFPYVLVVVEGGGTVEVNLPQINTINGSGTIIGIVGDSLTTLVMNVAGSDIISQNGGTTVASQSITGNKSFLIFDATTISTGGIWVDTTSSSGGGGGTPPFYYVVTYDALMSLISGSNLIAGAFYLINDFASATYIQFSGTGGGGIGGEEVHIGNAEPLLVQATTSTTLSGTAMSLAFPNDVIQYSVNIPDGFYEYAASQGKGCIIYREDTLNQIARDYDWRNVIFRRWETSVGSGNYWSIQPVTNADYIDITCFWNTGYKQNVYVKSPLQANVGITGFPYWLDNFVINAGNSCIALQVNLAYGSTYSEYTAGIGGLDACVYDVVIFDTVISDTISDNRISSSIENFINLGSGTFQNNNIGGFQNNNINDTNIGSITGNIISACYQNTINQLQYNSGSLLLFNQNNGDPININGNQGFAFITNNVCNQIIGNISDTISDNICTQINGNISNSINSNNNAGLIGNNLSNNINTNSNQGDISNNTVGNLIENNTNGGNISNNVCSVIQYNSNLYAISNNNVETITNNSNNGNIDNNIGILYDSNSNNGELDGNQVHRITNNTLDGSINGNIGITIDSNSGAAIDANFAEMIVNNQGGQIANNYATVIATNNVSAKITGNISHSITSNTIILGSITENNCVNINSNTITDGSITSNTGNSITSNQVGRGIDQNNCNIIDSNIMAGNIANNQYNIIANNTLVDITNSIGNQFFNNSGYPCIGIIGTVQNCDITTSPISSHNFIDEVISFTINPTAEMQTSTPTKSMYDEGLGQHYLALLSSGLFTFPTQITV